MGATVACVELALSVACFYPRPRDGGDVRSPGRRHEHPVSIHAPVMGATADLHRDPADYRVSIHAPVMGATLPGRGGNVMRVVSIHAPVMGATSEYRGVPVVSCVSIYARVMGATIKDEAANELYLFLSTPP